MDKILSFVVPSYNCEKFLNKCVSSFFDEKTLDKLDIVIVNDGSTDSTLSIAQELCEKYPHSVRVLSQANKGHGGALNTGLSAARGRYVKVIDADDWVETENLGRFAEILENAKADVVLTHHYTRNVTTGEVLKWKSFPPEGFMKEYTFEQIMESWKSFDRSLTFHGITYRTDFYRENCISLSEKIFYEDHEYATVPCCFAKSIMPVDLFVYNYRIGDVEQSVSDKNQLDRITHTEKVLNRLGEEYKASLNVLDENAEKYYCMKIQGLLLSYVTTALLVSKDRKRGRKLAKRMMDKFKNEIPRVYELAVKQYRVFKLLNRFHVSKKTWDRILKSKLYNKMRGNHAFD